MKNYLIRIINIIIILVIIVLSSYSVQAANDNELETGLLDPKFFQQMNPAKNDDDSVKPTKPISDVMLLFVNTVLSILQVIGAVILVLSIGLFGLNSVLSTNTGVAKALNFHIGETSNDYGKKFSTPVRLAELMDGLRYALIGSIILFMSTSIVRIAFNMFATL